MKSLYKFSISSEIVRRCHIPEHHPQQVSGLSPMENVASGIQSWCLSQYFPVASSIWSNDAMTCRAQLFGTDEPTGHTKNSK